MSAILPAPKSVDNITRLYSENKYINSRTTWLLRGLNCEKYIRLLEEGKSIRHGTASYDIFNMYFLFRSLNQVNEACNKLWGTMEIYQLLGNKRPSYKGFSSDFLSSTTLPTLHYANMSALVSILALFGVCSYVKRGQKLRFYNLVRAADEIVLQERTSYLVQIAGRAEVGWHRQVLQMYDVLTRLGIGLPPIRLSESRKLMDARNRVQYDILAQTSMTGTYGTELYFSFLPFVIGNIRVAISVATDVVGSLPNNADDRFTHLEKKAPDLIAMYTKQLR